MSAHMPIINEWQRLGLNWYYIIEPQMYPFTVPANGRLQVPRVNPVDFEGPEGVILNFTAAFDNPLCGLDAEFYPGFNFRRALVINNLIAGGYADTTWSQTVRVPPTTAPGIYIIEVAGLNTDWFWKRWCRLFIINSDANAAHRCLGLSYSLIILEDQRPKRPYLDAIDKVISAIGKLVR